MFTPRRMYVYLVSTISLQAFTWAIISLLRNLFISVYSDTTAIAFQTAIILISLPVYLGHWLWEQRVVDRDIEERGAVLRRLYLFGMQASFLFPFVASAFGLINILLFWLAGEAPRGYYPQLSSGPAIIFRIIPMVVLAILWYYHQRILAQDAKIVPLEGGSAVIRRLYVYVFSATGLVMTAIAVMVLLRWLLAQVGGDFAGYSGGVGFISEIARLAVGLPVWVLFWQWAQTLFIRGDEEERESALRKFYLYLIVFIAVLSSVTSATFILEGIIRRLIAISPLGASEGDIRIPISIIVTMAIMWAYHAQVIKTDIELAGEARRQAGLRRLYIYLIAAIGLSAFLVGISGILSVFIRSIDQTIIGTGLKQELAWFAAVTIAGLPVFFIPWRQAQIRAAYSSAEGTGERRSVVRRIYLYFFLFIAAITILSSVVYIVFRLIGMMLGEDPPTLSELGQPVAFSIIAGIVWYYHWSVLRTDRDRRQQEQMAQLEAFSVVIAGIGDEDFRQSLIGELEGKNLGASLVSLELAKIEAGSKDSQIIQETIDRLNQAGLIVGSWDIAIAAGAAGDIHPEVAKAVIDSPARKLLLPKRFAGWEWVGVERWNTEYFVRQAVNAVEQVIEGEEVRLVKPLGVGAILGIAIGVILLLILLAIPVLYFFGF